MFSPPAGALALNDMASWGGGLVVKPPSGMLFLCVFLCWPVSRLSSRARGEASGGNHTVDHAYRHNLAMGLSPRWRCPSARPKFEDRRDEGVDRPGCV